MKSASGSAPAAGLRRRGVWIYACLGIALGVVLLWWLLRQAGASLAGQDVAAVLPVLLWVVPWFLIPLVTGTWSWCWLFPAQRQPRLMPALVMTWIGLGVNWLLPVAMVGGEVVKLRLGLRRGWRAAYLIASLVGDKTLQVATQGLYTFTGLALLMVLSGRAQALWQSIVGLLLFCAALFVFYRLQQSGLFSGLAGKLARFSQHEESIRLGATRLDAGLRGMYKRRSRWWGAAAWRMVFRFSMAVEVWLVMYWLGEPVGPWHAVTLESLSQGARAAAFFIPAGLGAQEAGLVAVGLLLGVPAEALVLLALVKRLRELLVGGAALLVWQGLEGHWWWQRRGRAQQTPSDAE